MGECAIKVPEFGWLCDQVTWRALKRQLSSSAARGLVFFFKEEKRGSKCNGGIKVLLLFTHCNKCFYLLTPWSYRDLL